MVQYRNRLDQHPHVSPDEAEKLADVSRTFAFRTNSYYDALINWDDPDDPLRRIVMPMAEELLDNLDPDHLHELDDHAIPGVQRKYESQINLLVTDTCAAICRYCFRKTQLNGDEEVTTASPEKVAAWLTEHPEVTSVVITGGEPLILSTPRIDAMLAAIRGVESVTDIRISAKIFAFNPHRILDDDTLVESLGRHSDDGNRIWIGHHFSHPREFTPEAVEAVRRVRNAGVGMLNNVPMVRGVNDDPVVLAEVMNRVYGEGMTNYYVYCLSAVRGNRSLTVPLSEAYRIFDAARSRLTCSARTGKLVIQAERANIGILGVDDGRIVFQVWHARDPSLEGRIFSFAENADARFLNEYAEFHHGTFELDVGH